MTSYFSRGTSVVCRGMRPDPRVTVWYIAYGSDPLRNLPDQKASDVGIDPGRSGVPWQVTHRRARTPPPRLFAPPASPPVHPPGGNPLSLVRHGRGARPPGRARPP